MVEVIDPPEGNDNELDQVQRDQSIRLVARHRRFQERAEALQDAGVSLTDPKYGVVKAPTHHSDRDVDPKAKAKSKALRKAQKKARRAGR